MRHFFASLAVMLLLVSGAQAIPTEITYQGTIKEKGFPVTGTRTMMFRITDETGRRVYWSGGAQEVSVTNGLFSTRFTPSSVDWQSVTPFVEVSVNGQLLSPREPITATVYSHISADIMDGIVTPQKLAPSVSSYLVPAGAIVMFEHDCPDGWSRADELEGKFPMAAKTAGGTGGSESHNHSIASQSVNHRHMAPIFQTGNSGPGHGSARPQNNPWGGTEVGGSISVTSFSAGETVFNAVAANTSPNIESTAHDHGGVTGSASSIPPYYQLVFCKKN